MSSYESWIDRQIREAQEKGKFDNLPGTGKPLRDLRRDDENWWVKGLIEREQIKPLLPTSLMLRKEAEEIDETVADVRREQDVREIVEALNERIRDSHRRRVDGPLLVTKVVDVDAVVSRWRERRRSR